MPDAPQRPERMTVEQAHEWLFWNEACHHGSQRRKCRVCELEARAEVAESSINEAIGFLRQMTRINILAEIEDNGPADWNAHCAGLAFQALTRVGDR